MLNIYYFINIIIYSSVISFFIPFGSKSISLCEILITTFGSLILIQNTFKNILPNKFEFPFILFSFSKLSFTSLNISLRSISAILFISSLNFLKSNKKLIKTISNSTFNIILISTIGGLINSIIGNSLWSRFLLSLNFLPPSVNQIHIQTWWNNENGIISFFVTQNMLAQFMFTSFILISILKSLNYLNDQKFLISSSCIAYLLLMTKTSLGFFGFILLTIYMVNINLKRIFIFFKRIFLRFKFKLKYIFIIFLLVLLIMFFGSRQNLILNQLNLSKSFLELFLNFNPNNISPEVLDSSEFNRFYYTKIFFDNLDKCVLFGQSSFISSNTYNPHNFYLSIVHRHGLISIVFYLIFITSLFFNRIRIKEINSIYKLLFIYILLGGFQGDFFSDSRTILPFILIMFLGDAKTLKS